MRTDNDASGMENEFNVLLLISYWSPCCVWVEGEHLRAVSSCHGSINCGQLFVSRGSACGAYLLYLMLMYYNVFCLILIVFPLYLWNTHGFCNSLQPLKTIYFLKYSNFFLLMFYKLFRNHCMGGRMEFKCWDGLPQNWSDATWWQQNVTSQKVFDGSFKCFRKKTYGWIVMPQRRLDALFTRLRQLTVITLFAPFNHWWILLFSSSDNMWIKIYT